MAGQGIFDSCPFHAYALARKPRLSRAVRAKDIGSHLVVEAAGGMRETGSGVYNEKQRKRCSCTTVCHVALFYIGWHKPGRWLTH